MLRHGNAFASERRGPLKLLGEFSASRIAAIAAGFAGFLYFWLAPTGVPVPANRALGVLVMMAVWWVTEAFPIHWTAMVPLAVFPWLQVREGGLGLNLFETVRPYFDPNSFLFLGGMCIAVAMERHGLHRRIALNVMRLAGAGRLVLGFLLASAFISLWISNTATAVMMLPIGLAVIRQLEERQAGRLDRLGQAIMLAIAYGANVGGIGTKIGTAPNMQFAGFVRQRFSIDIGFLDYLWIGLPFALMLLPVVYAALTFLNRGGAVHAYSAEVLSEELQSLGPIRREETRVLGWFLVACALWIGAKPMKDALALGFEPDPVVAMSVAAMLFATRLLAFPDLRFVSWDALILLGGSFSLANAVKVSGLAAWGGRHLSAAAGLHPLALMLVIAAATVVLSAVASNTSTTQIMLEVVSAALGSSARPLPYLSAVTLASSCDFMLPAGTPPNAIVFGSGYVRLPAMAVTGFFLDAAAILLVTVWCHFGVARMF